MSYQGQPPQWPFRVLGRLCRPHFVEEIEGDLIEFYGFWRAELGKRRANWLFVWHLLKFLRPHTLKRPFHNYTFVFMLRNHVTISFRQIRRGKGYSILNIVSLSLGMIAFLLIQLWVGFERSVDDFHDNESRLYAVHYGAKGPDGHTGGYQIPFVFRFPSWDLKRDFTDELKEALPGIVKASEYHTLYDLPWGYPHTFRIGDVIHKLEGSVVEHDFLSMFSIAPIAGSFENALTHSDQIVISRQMASLFFQSPDEAIGQSIRYENRKDLSVAAVFEDLPSNSSLKFDYLLSWQLLQNLELNRSSNQASTYLLLDEGTDPNDLQRRLKGFLDERLADLSDVDVDLGLIPFHQKHLYADFVEGIPSGGKIEYLRMFSWIGLFLLVLAGINFSGLATARSVRRSKEIGVRKAVGSSKLQLVSQLMIEATLLAGISIVLALTVVSLALPALRTLTQLPLEFPARDLDFWLTVLGITMGTALFSGAYPSFYLASQRAGQVLKKSFRLSPSAVFFQKGLVIFQSFLAAAMLLGTLVVYQQTHFVKNSNLGYDRENIIYLPVEGELIEKYHLFKDLLSEMPGIAGVDRSSEAPHAMNFEVAEAINWQGKESGQQVGFYPTSVGFDYLSMMKLQVVDGRGFSKEFGTDTTAFMINEMAVREMGIEDPVGKWISAWDKRGRIVGILKDYHINSLHQPIRPVIMDVKEGLEFGNILIKTAPGQLAAALASTEQVASKLNPNYAVDIKFLDLEYEAMYRSEETASKLANGFTAFAIVIACLGLVGLAVVAAEQRRKEIGIRKVLGASVVHLVSVFSQRFIVLVAVAALLSLPITYILLSEWLSKFAYRIDIEWYHFLVVLCSSLLLGFLSISIQAFQTARLDPVDTLKLE